jgi:methionyl-tRNA formyltransferase
MTSPARLKVAFLSSDDAHQRFLAAELHRRFELVGLVVEPAASQRRRIAARRKYKDWAFATYHAWRRRLTGLDRYRRQYFSLPDQHPAWPPVPLLTVDWINDPKVAGFLERLSHDITLVMCTSIMGKKTLKAAGTIVNIHGGFLPYYRGNHCYFFALYHGAFDRIGSTIHFVDAGVDTGDIVDIVTPSIFADDNAERLYCRGEKLAIARLLELLDGLQHGEPLPRRPQPAGGKQYYTRDRNIYHDLNLWFRRRTGLLQMPKGRG